MTEKEKELGIKNLELKVKNQLIKMQLETAKASQSAKEISIILFLLQIICCIVGYVFVAFIAPVLSEVWVIAICVTTILGFSLAGYSYLRRK